MRTYSYVLGGMYIGKNSVIIVAVFNSSAILIEASNKFKCYSAKN